MEKENLTLSIDEPPFEIQVQSLTEIVAKYMQREHGSDDIDFFLNKGGNFWLEKGLRTDFKNGLTEEDFSLRESYFGNNRKERIVIPSLFSFFIEAFEDTLLKVLLVAGIVSIVLDMIANANERAIAWIEGFSIIFAALFVAFVQALNNRKKESEFQRLNEKMISGRTISCIRQGFENENFLVEEVQVGDLIVVKQGMEIPGDGILLHGFSVTIDESSMTGETKTMNKEPLDKCLSKKIDLES